MTIPRLVIDGVSGPNVDRTRRIMTGHSVALGYLCEYWLDVCTGIILGIGTA